MRREPRFVFIHGGGSGDWFLFRVKVDSVVGTALLILRASEIEDAAATLLAGPFPSFGDAMKARDDYFVVKEVMES